MIKRLSIFILVIFIFTLISIYYPSLQDKFSEENFLMEEKQSAYIIKIVDGDTLKTKKDTIRLLGINTPEKGQPYYQEAKNFLNQLNNKTIQIQMDKEDSDRYGRKLRYIYYNNDLINIQVLEQGLATTFLIENLALKEKFNNAQNQAKLQNLNLWKKSIHNCKECIELLELNPEEEYFTIYNNCNISCSLNGWTVKDDANHITKLKPIKANQKQNYTSKSNIWNNDGDRFFMRDKTGGLVIFYEY